jgi:1-aminocyclopropane-1-carboxylate deaminase
MSLDLDERFSRRSLAFFPSPLQKLERLSAALGVEVWAKRDDVSSGLAYGGNKVRKLEWLVADAIEQGCDTLVTIGGVQSNHTRQVAAVAAACGLKCRLVQEHWAEWEDPVYDKVGNILLSRLMGAKAVLEGEGLSLEVKETWEAALEEVRREGGTPYAIPAGASDHVLGGLGYANFADELERQEAELGLRFDTVVTATGTGSTQGGMLTGFKAQDRPRRLIGVDTIADQEAAHAAVLKCARQTAETIGLNDPIDDDDAIVDGRFAGPSYGVPDEETIAAIRMGAELEAMITDPVYEGKSLAGLIAMARERTIEPGSRVLYVHLGGTPAIHAYHRAFH